MAAVHTERERKCSCSGIDEAEPRGSCSIWVMVCVLQAASAVKLVNATLLACNIK